MSASLELTSRHGPLPARPPHLDRMDVLHLLGLGSHVRLNREAKADKASYPASWATVALFVSLGLTWWESCLAVLVGSVFVAIVITGECLRAMPRRSVRALHAVRRSAVAATEIFVPWATSTDRTPIGGEAAKVHH